MASERKNITLDDAARAALARFAAVLGSSDSAAIAEALRRADLPPETQAQLRALSLDLDMDTRDVLMMAVAQLYQRELGTPERDVFAELDAIKARIGME